VSSGKARCAYQRYRSIWRRLVSQREHRELFRARPLATVGERVRGSQCSFDEIKGHLAANVSGCDSARRL